MNNKLRLTILLLLAAVVLFGGLGAREFITRGEAREAIVAQSMFNSGDWLIGVGYNDAIPSKPPFLHWLINLCSSIQGQVSEFSARLPSAIFSFLFLIYFFKFLSRKDNSHVPLVSAFILLSSVEWFRSSIECRVDLVLSALLAFGLIELFCWEERELEGNPYRAQLAFACASLTKGPVSIVLPIVITGVYFLIKRRSLGQVILSCIQVFAPAVLLYGGWYALCSHYAGERFIDKVYAENIQRFAGTMDDEPHKHSAFYLYGTLLLGFMPWTLLLGLTFLSRTKKMTATGIDFFRKLRDQDSFMIFAAICTLAFLAFYSIPSSKRSVYLLPIYPFCAYFIAKLAALRTQREDRVLGRLVKLFALIVLIISAIVATVCAGWLNVENFKLSADSLESFKFAINVLKAALSTASGLDRAIALLPIGVACLVLTYPRLKYPLNREVVSACSIILSLYLSMNAFFLPKFSEALSAKPFVSKLLSEIGPTQKIYSYGNEFYALSFYSGRMVYRLEDEKGGIDGYVVTYEKNLPKVEQITNKQGLFVKLFTSPTPVFELDENLAFGRLVQTPN